MHIASVTCVTDNTVYFIDYTVQYSSCSVTVLQITVKSLRGTTVGGQGLLALRVCLIDA